MFLCESVQYINLVFANLYFHPYFSFNKRSSSLDGDPNELIPFWGVRPLESFVLEPKKVIRLENAVTILLFPKIVSSILLFSLFNKSSPTSSVSPTTSLAELCCFLEFGI